MTVTPKLIHLISLSLAAAGAGALSGCAASSQSSELANAKELIQRYEQKYGKLDEGQGRRDFRDLQRELRGRSMKEVTAKLGRPGRVENFGQTESWAYFDAAYDPATKRVVRQMTVWFQKGVVDETRASF